MSYSPTLGRWAEPDPHPVPYVDGMSAYEYEVSAPTTELDPLGLTVTNGSNDKYWVGMGGNKWVVIDGMSEIRGYTDIVAPYEGTKGVTPGYKHVDGVSIVIIPDPNGGPNKFKLNWDFCAGETWYRRPFNLVPWTTGWAQFFLGGWVDPSTVVNSYPPNWK
jgi:hypothetical protein